MPVFEWFMEFTEPVFSKQPMNDTTNQNGFKKHAL